MTIERIKGCVAYSCDLPGCHEGLETDRRDFGEARDLAKEEGWVTRPRDDIWKNYCCKAHEEMDFRGQSLVRGKK